MYEHKPRKSHTLNTQEDRNEETISIYQINKWEKLTYGKEQIGALVQSNKRNWKGRTDSDDSKGKGNFNPAKKNLNIKSQCR